MISSLTTQFSFDETINSAEVDEDERREVSNTFAAITDNTFLDEDINDDWDLTHSKLYVRTLQDNSQFSTQFSLIHCVDATKKKGKNL